MSTPTPDPTHTLAPVDGVIMPLKTLDDWRAFFHQIVPVIVTVLVGSSIITNDQATLWVSIAFAIADPLLSIRNTTDKVRTITYSLLALLQAGSGVSQIVEMTVKHTDPVVAPYITLAGAIASGVLANLFTPTPSSIKPVAIEDVR